MANTLGKIIGRGRTADVYQYTDSSVLKLLNPGFPEWFLESEAKAHTIVQNLGLPVPKLLDKTKIDGRCALIYQKINGITLIEALKKNPHNILKYSRDMAALHFDIGKTRSPHLQCNKERLLSGISRQSVLSKQESDKATGVLQILRRGDVVCHCDFHPGNIMTDGENYWIIDWNNSSSGCFEADVMRTYMILSHATDPNGQLSALLSRAAGFAVKKAYIKHLLKLSAIDMNEILSWEIPTIAARFSENVPKSEELSLMRRLDKVMA